MMTIKIKVWDLPLRLFHWLLVLAVVAAYVTGELGGLLIDWHGRIGSSILGLLVFRLIWGFIGTEHSRFTSFAPTPARVVSYLKGEWKGHGHSPIGGLSVLVLLLVLSIQAGTGLFANDDIAFEGPLFNLISKDFSDTLSDFHTLFFYGLILVIFLHLLAIIYYRIFEKNNLVTPMLTGKKVVKDASQEYLNSPPPRRHREWLRFLLAAAIAGVVVWLINSSLLAGYLHPTQAIVATPTW